MEKCGVPLEAADRWRTGPASPAFYIDVMIIFESKTISLKIRLKCSGGLKIQYFPAEVLLSHCMGAESNKSRRGGFSLTHFLFIINHNGVSRFQ